MKMKIPYTKLSVVILPLLLLLFCSFRKQDGDPFKELKALNDKYRTMKEYSMDISYLLYATHSSNKVEHTSMAHYVKKDKKIYMKVDKVQTLQTEQYLVVVSEQDKQIYLARPTHDAVAESSVDVIEKALSKYSTLTSTEQGGSRIYTVVFKTGTSPYEKITIRENMSSHCIEKMEMLLSQPMKVRPEDPKCKEEKPRMEVVFSGLQFKNDTDAGQLNESTYFHKKGKGYEPAPTYKNYKLINNYH